jgi:hypothetical protein
LKRVCFFSTKALLKYRQFHRDSDGEDNDDMDDEDEIDLADQSDEEMTY